MKQANVQAEPIIVTFYVMVLRPWKILKAFFPLSKTHLTMITTLYLKRKAGSSMYGEIACILFETKSLSAV